MYIKLAITLGVGLAAVTTGWTQEKQRLGSEPEPNTVPLYVETILAEMEDVEDLALFLEDRSQRIDDIIFNMEEENRIGREFGVEMLKMGRVRIWGGTRPDLLDLPSLINAMVTRLGESDELAKKLYARGLEPSELRMLHEQASCFETQTKEKAQLIAAKGTVLKAAQKSLTDQDIADFLQWQEQSYREARLYCTELALNTLSSFSQKVIVHFIYNEMASRTHQDRHLEVAPPARIEWFRSALQKASMEGGRP